MSEMDLASEVFESTFACKDCNSTFEDANGFHSHKCSYAETIELPKFTTHNNIYKCEKCGKKYKEKRYLFLHLQNHLETSDFTCTLCGKQFKTKVRLQIHIQTHTARYVCHVCNKGFGESGNLKKHLRIHSGERPFVCDICQRSFTQKRHLQDHQHTHSGDPDNQCDVCGRKFLTKQTLIVHKYIHNTELPFGCKQCNESFSEYNNLKVHLCPHTQDKSFYCNVCGKGFKRHYDLRAHLTVHTDEQPYACELCDRRFHKIAILKMHMESHTNERNYVCHLCNKAFKTFNVLKKHCLLHSGERNKTCKICNKSFKCNNTLRTHYLTHSDERPFACEICGKSFKRITPLQNHLTTHTGELPFPCEVCGKRFARKGTLENHFILHTGERPYVCPICQKSFTRKSSLKIHDATVHTKDIDPKKIDNKACHLIAGDIARHAILSSHAYVAKSGLKWDKEVEKNTEVSESSEIVKSEKIFGVDCAVMNEESENNYIKSMEDSTDEASNDVNSEDIDVTDNEKTLSSDEEKIDNKACHLIADDIARHAILSSHAYIAKSGLKWDKKVEKNTEISESSEIVKPEKIFRVECASMNEDSENNYIKTMEDSTDEASNDVNSDIDIDDNGKTLSSDEEKIDIKSCHLIADDIAQHAILSSHVYAAKSGLKWDKEVEKSTKVSESSEIVKSGKIFGVECTGMNEDSKNNYIKSMNDSTDKASNDINSEDIDVTDNRKTLSSDEDFVLSVDIKENVDEIEEKDVDVDKQ